MAVIRRKSQDLGARRRGCEFALAKPQAKRGTCRAVLAGGPRGTGKEFCSDLTIAIICYLIFIDLVSEIGDHSVIFSSQNNVVLGIA